MGWLLRLYGKRFYGSHFGNMLVGKSQTLMAHNCKGEVLVDPGAGHPCGRVGQNEFRRDDMWFWKTPLIPVRYG